MSKCGCGKAMKSKKAPAKKPMKSKTMKLKKSYRKGK
jgi:hypothetical protein